MLADTNFWLALSISTHNFHPVARDWFNKQSPSRPILFCRSTQQSFVRLLSTEAILRLYGVPPMTNAAAWAVYEGIRSDHRTGFAVEPSTLETRWKRLAARNSASPKLWMDAYLAAFALAGGHKFVTTDHGFKQFNGLDLILL